MKMVWHNRITIVAGDITRQHADATSMQQTRPSLMEAGLMVPFTGRQDPGFWRNAGHRGCATGDAGITGAYNLPARSIIHTVGPG